MRPIFEFRRFCWKIIYCFRNVKSEEIKVMEPVDSRLPSIKDSYLQFIDPEYKDEEWYTDDLFTPTLKDWGLDYEILLNLRTGERIKLHRKYIHNVLPHVREGMIKNHFRKISLEALLPEE